MIIYIYLLTVAICFVLSLITPKARQNFLWLYFAIVLFFEIGIYYKLLSYSYYTLVIPIYTLFFIFYYSLNYKRKYIHYILALCVIIGSIYFYDTDDNSQIIMGVMMSLIYILLSLIWFFSQLKNPSLTPIYKKQGFWISTTLLFMGIVFIFRMIPMNIFEVTDKSFLKLINKGFQYSIIASYILFLKASTCKA